MRALVEANERALSSASAAKRALADERLRDALDELAVANERFLALREDFRHNLELLRERDAHIDRVESELARLRADADAAAAASADASAAASAAVSAAASAPDASPDRSDVLRARDAEHERRRADRAESAAADARRLLRDARRAAADADAAAAAAAADARADAAVLAAVQRDDAAAEDLRRREADLAAARESLALRESRILDDYEAKCAALVEGAREAERVFDAKRAETTRQMDALRARVARAESERDDAFAAAEKSPGLDALRRDASPSDVDALHARVARLDASLRDASESLETIARENDVLRERISATEPSFRAAVEAEISAVETCSSRSDGAGDEDGAFESGSDAPDSDVEDPANVRLTDPETRWRAAGTAVRLGAALGSNPNPGASATRTPSASEADRLFAVRDRLASLSRQMDDQAARAAAAILPVTPAATARGVLEGVVAAADDAAASLAEIERGLKTAKKAREAARAAAANGSFSAKTPDPRTTKMAPETSLTTRLPRTPRDRATFEAADAISSRVSRRRSLRDCPAAAADDDDEYGRVSSSRADASIRERLATMEAHLEAGGFRASPADAGRYARARKIAGKSKSRAKTKPKTRMKNTLTKKRRAESAAARAAKLDALAAPRVRRAPEAFEPPPFKARPAPRSPGKENADDDGFGSGVGFDRPTAPPKSFAFDWRAARNAQQEPEMESRDAVSTIEGRLRALQWRREVLAEAREREAARWEKT